MSEFFDQVGQDAIRASSIPDLIEEYRETHLTQTGVECEADMQFLPFELHSYGGGILERCMIQLRVSHGNTQQMVFLAADLRLAIRYLRDGMTERDTLLGIDQRNREKLARWTVATSS